MRKLIFGIFLAAFGVALVPFAIASIILAEGLGIERKRFGLVWYNLDRTLASGAWETEQETISSEVGRIARGAGQVDGWTPRSKLEEEWAKRLANWLDTTPALWGADHTKKAIAHADLLDKADDGREQ